MEENFIIVYMPKTDDAQIILDQPILATVGCRIDVRKGRITFKGEGRYVVFCHLKEDVVSPSSSLLDALPLSPEIDMEDVLNCEDLPDFDWISYEDPDRKYVNVEFAAPMPPNTPEVEVPILNNSSMSDNCRFTQVVLFMPPIEDLMQILIWGLNKFIVTHLIDHECALFCSQIMYYGTVSCK